MTTEEQINNISWGGSGIERVTFDFILKTIPVKSTIIELGAGRCSTFALSLFYDLHTVEENSNYLNLYKNVNYIHAPLINNWYDREVLNKTLPKDHTFVFVDGPAGESKRVGILDNLDLFNPKASFLVHDTYRPTDNKLAKNIAEKLGKNIMFNATKDYFAYIW